MLRGGRRISAREPMGLSSALTQHMCAVCARVLLALGGRAGEADTSDDVAVHIAG